MFGKKKKEYKEPVPPILVVTSNDIPGRKYKPLGLVTATGTSPTTLSLHITELLMIEAQKLGADAIIGFRAISAGPNQMKWFSVGAYGTAIKFTDSEQIPIGLLGGSSDEDEI